MNRIIKPAITPLIISIIVIAYFVTPAYLKKAIRYGTVNIDDYKIFDNRTIQASNPIPWAITKDYNHYTLSEHQRQILENNKTVAFLVIQNDSILYEEYWDNYSEKSLSNSFSAAKSINALLIGAAIDDGYIRDLNQPIGDYLPEFNDGKSKKITIKHLLTMSSGLNWHEAYANPFSVTTKAYYGNNLPELVLNLKPVAKPGITFSYKSGDTQLLSLILRKATGKTLSQYTEEKLWRPLGCEQMALWSLDMPNGYEKSYCCLNSNARDFAKIGTLILHNGQFDDKTIISGNFLQEATSEANFLKDKNGKYVDFYGYQWWIHHFKGQQIPYARGILGQYIFVIPKRKAIVVRLGHKRNNTLIITTLFALINIWKLQRKSSAHEQIYQTENNLTKKAGCFNSQPASLYYLFNT